MAVREILPIAVAAAREAGALIKEHFGKVHHVTYKGVIDPVTEVDLASEALICRHLKAAFPDHAILAEEMGGKPWDTPGALWIIDPLDGTKNFAHNFPHVGVSIGLLYDGMPEVGVVYDPLRDELFTAQRGKGAALNGKSLHVSAVADLADALLGTGFPYDSRTAADNNTRRLDHFLRRSQGIRRAGAAVLDLAYVACGRLDGFWELGLKPWDVTAGMLLVLEAGGRVTDFKDRPLPLGGSHVVASNGWIHEAMLRVIREGAKAPYPDSSIS